MNIFTSLKRGLASLGAASVLFASIAVPVASADELSFVNSLPETFNITTQDNIEFEIEKTEPNTDKQITFFITPEGGNAVDMGNFTFGEFTNFTFAWDGKLQGQDVAPGKYTASFLGLDINGIEHEFMVVNAEPMVNFNPAPAEEFLKTQLDYSVSVDLSDFANETKVTLYWVNLDNNLQFAKDTFSYTGNGNHVFKLDVADLDLGKQRVAVKGVDSEGNPTNEITHDFVLQQQIIVDTTCAGYLDIDQDDANCKAIEWLKDEGIMTGQGGNEFFDADGILNRAEVSKIALEAHNKFNGNNGQCGTFPDVQAGQWFSPYICEGVAIGMITGYKAPDPNAGMFLPANDVSIIEMFTLLLRPLDQNFVGGASYNGLDADQWYSPFAKYSRDNDLYTGSDVTPTQKATRLEVGVYIYNMDKAGLL